jgi:hypothetical protein
MTHHLQMQEVPMIAPRFRLLILFVAPVALFASCADGGAPPTAVDTGGMDHMMHGSTTLMYASTLDPFTFRASLDPYRIHQLPDFLMHSQAQSDIVMQRLVFAPGAGPWHTHPGPSFVYVIQGSIRLDRYNKKDGCFQTPAHGPGAAYFEVGEEVHRAVVLGSEDAILLVTRFNIPPGAMITVPAADPGC